MFKGTALSLIVNFAIMIVLGLVLSVVGSIFFPPDPEMGQHPVMQNLNFYLFFSVVFGMGGAFVSLYMSKWLVKRAYGLEIIDPKTAHGASKELVDMVHQISRKAKLPKMPEVAIYNSEEVNAFATGPSKSNSLVAVSTGLLHSMDRDSLEGVLGHEVGHIANGDMVAMTLVAGVLNSFVIFFSRIIAIFLTSDRDGGRSYLAEFFVTLLFQYILGFLAMFVVNWFSRLREYRADKASARLTSKEKMISALEVLQRKVEYATSERLDPEGQFAAFKISGGKSKGSFLDLARKSHPDLSDRIARLRSLTSLN